MRKTSATRSARWFASFGLAATSLVALGISAASAAEVGKLVRVTTGDPFAGCTADKVGKQIGTNYPATEIEPWVAADPTDPNRLLAGHQQDRWSNGGSRGLVGSVSTNGGASWKRVIPGKVTECEGGPWNRASDPWVDFSTTGIAYFSHLALGPTLANGNNVNSAQVVTRSLDGGRTWEAPVTIIRDNNQHILDDKTRSPPTRRGRATPTSSGTG